MTRHISGKLRDLLLFLLVTATITACTEGAIPTPTPSPRDTPRPTATLPPIKTPIPVVVEPITYREDDRIVTRNALSVNLSGNRECQSLSERYNWQNVVRFIRGNVAPILEKYSIRSGFSFSSTGSIPKGLTQNKLPKF